MIRRNFLKRLAVLFGIGATLPAEAPKFAVNPVGPITMTAGDMPVTVSYQPTIWPLPAWMCNLRPGLSVFLPNTRDPQTGEYLWKIEPTV